MFSDCDDDESETLENGVILNNSEKYDQIIYSNQDNNLQDDRESKTFHQPQTFEEQQRHLDSPTKSQSYNCLGSSAKRNGNNAEGEEMSPSRMNDENGGRTIH
jgi:hypothetical protein